MSATKEQIEVLLVDDDDDDYLLTKDMLSRLDGPQYQIHWVSDYQTALRECHERVFTAFERLHSRSAYEGTGIGLSIARKIAWRHGGHIAAVGNPGNGATFTITLPVQHTNGGTEEGA